MIFPLDRVIEAAGLTKDKIDCVLLAGGSSRIPKVQEDLIEYFGKGPNFLKQVMNPDEVVSQGACVLAGML